jgi:hypothetical protein
MIAQGDENTVENGTPDDDNPLPLDGQEEPDTDSVDADEAKKDMEAHEAEQKAKQQKIKEASDAAQKESGQVPDNPNPAIPADDSKGFGIYANATSKAKGAAVKPDVSATNALNFASIISINKVETADKPAQAQFQSDRGAIHIEVNNAGMRVKAESKATGSAFMGFSDAWSEINASLQNTIWVDYTTLQSRAGGVTLLAQNGAGDEKPYFYVKSDSTADALFCSASADVVLQGRSYNQIRTTNAQSVAVRGKFTHIAVHPTDSIHYTLEAHHENLYSSGSGGENFSWGAAKYRCDFCEEGQGNTDDRTRYSDGNRADLQAAFSKALSPLNDIQAMTAKLNGITKARYGDEDYAEAGKIFVLELQPMLEKDVRLETEDLTGYRLWTNGRTFQEVLLLPNSTRLYATAGLRIEYVVDVIYGDALGNGENHYIDIITALSKKAFDEPVIPIGSTGSLDMKTGVLTLPSMADYELCMHEVSSSWMKDRLAEGYISLLSANQEEINQVTLNDGGSLPEGTILTGMTEDGGEDGWTRYWLGLTPETAPNADTPLYYMLVNEETDEMKIFRTSVNLLAEGAEPVTESMYLYRDSESDMNGEEKYHCMLFDTPKGQKSIIKVVTNILEERDIILPLAMRITLRSFTLDGADLPAYSLGDHLFAMNDGTDGIVSMFDEFYTATFDGDTFESDYIRIENIRGGNPAVVIKKGQMIWAEHAGEGRATDIAGNSYVCVDGVWYAEDETPQLAADLQEDAA